MKTGFPFLAFLLLSAVPLPAEITSVKAVASNSRPPVRKAVPVAQKPAPAKGKAAAAKPSAKTVPPAKTVAKAIVVSTRPPAKAVSTKAKPAAPRKTAAKSKSGSAVSKKATSSSRPKSKVPVIILNRSEYIDISFPEPPGARRSTREQPPVPVKKAEPVEEIPGVPPAVSPVTEDSEALAAAER